MDDRIGRLRQQLCSPSLLGTIGSESVAVAASFRDAVQRAQSTSADPDFAGERTMAVIASILEVPEGTVRSDIARARAVITAALRSQQ